MKSKQLILVWLSLLLIAGITAVHTDFLRVSGDAIIDGDLTVLGVESVPFGVKYIESPVVIVISTVDMDYAIPFADSGSYLITHTNDSVSTIQRDGRYLIIVSCSFTHNQSASLVHAHIFVDDVENHSIEGERKIAAGGDFGAVPMSGIIFLSAGEEIKAKISADKTGDLTINHMNFSIIRSN